jgi:hypothetical protein
MAKNKMSKEERERLLSLIEIPDTGSKEQTWAEKEEAENQEMFEVHLRHEVKMLNDTYTALFSPPPDGTLHDALIESFCIHARAICEFFKYKSEFDPRQFVDVSFQIEKRFIDDEMYNKLNEQIAHLSRKRKRLTKDKIGPEERRYIYEKVCEELEDYQSHLIEPYKTIWQPPFERVRTLKVTSQASATGHVTERGWTGYWLSRAIRKS